jgi:Tat protein translocase TatC
MAEKIKAEDREMSFGEHIEELRRRLTYALGGILLAAIVCGVFFKQVMAWVFMPLSQASDRISDEAKAMLEAAQAAAGPDGAVLKDVLPPLPPSLIIGSPFYGILSIILVTSVVGLFLASPWVIYQVWAFVSVGLRAKERKFIKVYGPVSFLLFIAGGAVFFFLLAAVALEMLVRPMNMINQYLGKPIVAHTFELEYYLTFIAWMTMIFGVCFQTPLVVLFLARTEIVPIETLIRKQKIIIFVLILVGALLAPGADPISCSIMGAILIVLYELGIVVAWLSVRRARKRNALRDAGLLKDEDES